MTPQAAPVADGNQPHARIEESAALASPKQGKPPFYISGLDGLRGIAFLLVFLAHAGASHIVPGGFGVTVFFFLSGYLITTLLRKESERHAISLSQFYLRRARRILPPMYICLALGLVLNHFGLLATTMRFNGAALLAVLLYYYNYYQIERSDFGLPGGLDVAWSLMIEEHFYLIFPPAYKYFLTRKFSNAKQAWILVSVCMLPFLWRFVIPVIFHGQKAVDWAYKSTDTRFDSILWGCVLAIAANPIYKTDIQFRFLDAHKAVLALMGVGIILLCLLYRDEYFRDTARYTLIPLSLYPIFFYCVRSPRSVVGRLLEMKGLREIGSLSYTMYLTHWLFLQATPRYLKVNHLVTVVIAFFLTLLFAFCMRALVENPLRQAFRK